MTTIVEDLHRAAHLHQLGDFRSSDEICHRILAVNPNIGDAWHLLGRSAYNQGRFPEAKTALTRAHQLVPDVLMVLRYLGLSYKELGDLNEASSCFRRALEIDPNYFEARLSLANVLQDSDHLAEAESAYRKCLELKPHDTSTLTNLGALLRKCERFDEAIACYQAVLAQDANVADSHNNLGNVFTELGRIDEAIASYQRAIELRPDFAMAHLNLSGRYLLLGDWENSWSEFAWRWKTKELTPRTFHQPLWQGEDLTGKTILLHAEQGLGDTLQYVRYALLLKQRGAQVILECQRPLLPLLANFPVDQVIASGGKIPPFDVHVPLLTLPEIFQTRIDNVPVLIPYLRAAPERVVRWRDRLSALRGFNVGIAWRGNPMNSADRLRSVPLRMLAPLARVLGIHFINLQKGAEEEISQLRGQFSIVDFADDLDPPGQAFMDTAAVMQCLDLVITVDTSVCHLAGALGVPTWVALHFVPDGRWLLDRRDTPWYPTMQLFRQKTRGDWSAVFSQMQAALRRELETNNKR